MAVNDLKPYYLIHWRGWPVNPAEPVNLEPNEEKYISFSFLEPTGLSGTSEVGTQYLGVEEKHVIPKKARDQAQLYDLYVPYVKKDSNFVYPIRLRDEVSNGLVKYHLIVGSVSIEISPALLKDFRRLSEESWNNMPASRLYYQYPY